MKNNGKYFVGYTPKFFALTKKHVDEHTFTCYYIYNKNEHKFVRGADIIAFLLYAMYNV